MAIMDKLGLHTTAELTRYAMERGIGRTTHSVRGKEWRAAKAERDSFGAAVGCIEIPASFTNLADAVRPNASRFVSSRQWS